MVGLSGMLAFLIPVELGQSGTGAGNGKSDILRNQTGGTLNSSTGKQVYQFTEYVNPSEIVDNSLCWADQGCPVITVKGLLMQTPLALFLLLCTSYIIKW